MRQIFQLGQVWQLKIERVNDEPAVNRNRNQNNPKHRHGDVVEENQIVDDGEKEECKKSEAGEDSKAPQPRNNFILVFLKMGKKL